VSLLRFYLKAPFFLGGSSAKARALAHETESIDPDVARLLSALIAFDDGQNNEAQKLVLSADLTAYEMIEGAQRDLLFQLAQSHLDAKRYQESSRLFNELNKRFSNSEYGHYGLALVAQKQGQTGDMISHLEKALVVTPKVYVYKLLGETYQAANNAQKAIAAYQSALALNPGPPQSQREQIESNIVSLLKSCPNCK
jgi:tetratricopeptide (TPR) repeat protein